MNGAGHDTDKIFRTREEPDCLRQRQAAAINDTVYSAGLFAYFDELKLTTFGYQPLDRRFASGG